MKRCEHGEIEENTEDWCCYTIEGNLRVLQMLLVAKDSRSTEYKSCIWFNSLLVICSRICSRINLE